MTQVSWRQVERRKRLVPLLATFIVILGMLNIPVECAVAAGPHSLFLAPETVAELQQRKPHAAFTSPARHALPASTPMERGSGASDKHSHPALPTPAGFASRAIPPRVIANPLRGPRLVGLIPHISTWVAPLLERKAMGPEPPPPNMDERRAIRCVLLGI